MIRATGTARGDAPPLVILGLTPDDLDLLRTGRVITVNPTDLDPRFPTLTIALAYGDSHEAITATLLTARPDAWTVPAAPEDQP